MPAVERLSLPDIVEAGNVSSTLAILQGVVMYLHLDFEEEPFVTD